jgi:hypothetical protein
MDIFDDRWEDENGYDVGPDSDPEELYLSLISDEEGHRYWSESAWSHPADDGVPADALLFADRCTETALSREIRLSELWEQCQRGSLTLGDFLELSALITEVDGIRGSLCADCAMLDRPNVGANWTLGTTGLCRAHLRFRLAYARIDGGGAQHPA